MQRTSDHLEDQRDVGDRVDVSELIARISAERNDSFGSFGDSGADDAYDDYGDVDDLRDFGDFGDFRGSYDVVDPVEAEDALTDTAQRRLWVGVDELTARLSAEHGFPLQDTGQHRWVGVNELTARIAAERGDPIDELHRHRLRVDVDDRRARRRRLAPAIAGVATVLVATTAALTLRHGDTPSGPELNAALVGASSPSPAAVQVPAPIVVPGPAVVGSPGTAAPVPNGAPAVPPAGLRPGVAGAPKPAPAAPAVDEGVQAARQNGWKLVDRDEFTTAIGAKWSKYDGEGNAGEGRRTPGAIAARNGAAVIRGDAKGATGGMVWRDARRTGRWEMRAKFPKGDAQYHPVLLLWPGEGGSDDGEIDFAETTSASNSVSFFLHHGSDEQETAKKQLDLTQWHNYAVEVTSDRVTGYVDGQKWFESTDRDTLPREAVHPVIQLDWFPKGDSPEPSELQVDWMRIYQ